MKKTLNILSSLACVLLAACGSARATPIPVQKLALSKSQAVFIDVDSGTLEISGGDSGVAEISGQLPLPEAWGFSLTRAGDGIHILAKNKSPWFWEWNSSLLRLDLRAPNGVPIKINSFDATIDIHDFSGKVNITSVSGEIDVRDSSGVFVISSNRGNVAIETTSGELHVLGNYGVLSMKDTRGGLDASTIMGTVRFVGEVGASDNLVLETDHGPVEIQLGQASDVAVHVVTTSGEITCVVPGLSYEGQGCGGTLGSGKGQLSVRTVSGSVTLEQLP